MSQVQIIIDSLKKILKMHSVTYADIAKGLNLSESSVKRLFTTGELTLARIDKICQLANIDICDLFYIAKSSKIITELTFEQERTLVSEVKLLLVATCVVNYWSLDDILSYYNLSYHECLQKLVVLDKMKLIELLPNDRFKLRISQNFRWLPNGPIKQFFQKHLQNDFLDSQFVANNEFFNLTFGMLTDESNAVLQRKLRQLADNFSELSIEDVPHGFNKRHRSVLLLALRPWSPKLFEELKREPE